MAQNKEGKFVIDIGANVGDTLIAMWNQTNDKFLCVEPTQEFLGLLIDNVKRMMREEQVYIEQAFITDKMEYSYIAKVYGCGTAHKEQIDSDIKTGIPSITVDHLLKKKNIEWKEVDLLKIDTDGFDGDCILSADKLLTHGNALVYWENYIGTFEQYKKYLEAYTFLNQRGYSTFYIFDNYGNYLCRGDICVICSIADYIQRVHTGCIGNTFEYYDVLACKEEDCELCEKSIKMYLKKYPLQRIE